MPKMLLTAKAQGRKGAAQISGSLNPISCQRQGLFGRRIKYRMVCLRTTENYEIQTVGREKLPCVFAVENYKCKMQLTAKAQGSGAV
jgi:hypothetical protein